jgi:SAM-dependent methyltransferase
MSYSCRVCGSENLNEVLDMGVMPLAGDFLSAGVSNELFPLAIDGCESCGVLQVREIVDQSLLFGPAYCYASSTIPDLVKHFRSYAQSASRKFGEGRKKRLLEIGCNDGVFLKPLAEFGFDVVGIDASENVANMAQSKGLDVHVGFFGKETASNLKESYGEFDVVTCSNMFAHNPDVNEIIEAVDDLLSPEGEFWIEVHSAHKLYEELQWDCFYHEHCFYWTIEALVNCMAMHGFKLKHYENTDMHGGALRAAFSKTGKSAEIFESNIKISDWQSFRQKCLRSRELIRECVEQLPVHYAYGAAGRAVMLINWAGIADQLDFVVDGSSLRYGKVIPNTSVPIISEEEFFARQDCTNWCFVTAHNYFEGIREKVDLAFPAEDIKFILPLPGISIR